MADTQTSEDISRSARSLAANDPPRDTSPGLDKDPSAGLGVSTNLEKNLLSVARDSAKESAGLVGDTKANLAQDRARAAEAFKQSQLQETPKWDSEAEGKKHQTDPVEAFASLGSVFGILASAFTHAPMESALNASASAINAIKASDAEGYKRAHEAWKQNTDLALKRAELERGRFQDAVSLMQTDMTAGVNMMKMHAIEVGDKQVQAMAEAGMFPQIIELQNARASLAEKMTKVVAEQQENMVNMGILQDYRQKEVEAFKEAHEGREPTELEKPPLKTAADKKYKEYMASVKRSEHSYGAGLSLSKEDAAEVASRTAQKEAKGIPHNQAFEEARSEVAQIAKSAKTGGQIAKEEEKAQKVESVRNQIKEAVRLIRDGRKTGDSVTGVKGAIGTAKEFFVGDKSEHARFTGLINTIQQEVKPLLTGSTRSMLTKADRATVDTIVPGLGFLRNEKQAEDVLIQLDKILSRADLGAVEGGIALPERFKNELDGTEIPRKSDGKIFIKRGEQLIPKD